VVINIDDRAKTDAANDCKRRTIQTLGVQRKVGKRGGIDPSTQDKRGPG
jgi:hypothetical protein